MDKSVSHVLRLVSAQFHHTYDISFGVAQAVVAAVVAAAAAAEVVAAAEVEEEAVVAVAAQALEP